MSYHDGYRDGLKDAGQDAGRNAKLVVLLSEAGRGSDAS